ncbi:hypothetical protein PTKIN_Ptkin06aG0090500 [Pterospermum kingtungense]
MRSWWMSNKLMIDRIRSIVVCWANNVKAMKNTLVKEWQVCPELVILEGFGQGSEEKVEETQSALNPMTPPPSIVATTVVERNIVDMESDCLREATPVMGSASEDQLRADFQEKVRELKEAVDSIRSGDDLALLWLEETGLEIKSYSANHIDELVGVIDSDKWCIMGFCRNPITGKRMNHRSYYAI